MARLFAPSIRPPWTIAACAFAGAASTWIVTSSVGLLLRSGLGSLVVFRTESLEQHVAYCGWMAITHALAALLYQRRPNRGSPLALWTFIGSTIVPGAFLSFLFFLVGGARVLRPELFLEPALLGFVPALFAVPLVATIAAAEREPVPGRALAVLAGGLFVPWFLGDDRVFSIALVGALTLSALALALASTAARDEGARVRLVRTGVASYRANETVTLVVDRAAPDTRGISRVGWAAALVVALGVIQIAVLVHGVG